jgi:hypothetical protein
MVRPPRTTIQSWFLQFGLGHKSQTITVLSLWIFLPCCVVRGMGFVHQFTSINYLLVTDYCSPHSHTRMRFNVGAAHRAPEDRNDDSNGYAEKFSFLCTFAEQYDGG